MSIVGLYSGLSGVRAAQTAIDVASHNVANANTPGYTRQRVELVAQPSHAGSHGRVGSGVDVAALNRLRDDALDARFRSSVGDEQFALARLQLLGGLEEATGEPDHGIGVHLSRLWDATEDWANGPSDPVTRTQVLHELDALVSRVGSISGAWDTAEQQAAERVDAVVDQVNRTLQDLDDLNRRIANLHVSNVGSEAFDTRDRLLDELAELVGARSVVDEDGAAVVTIGGETLLDGDGVGSLVLTGRDVDVVTAAGGTVQDVTVRGQVGGLQSFLRDDLTAARDRMDSFVERLVTEVNTVNAAGFTDDGQPGEPLLALGDPGEPFATLQLAVGLGDIDRLAAAGSVDGSGAVSPHDGQNAQRLSSLAHSSFVDPGAAGLDTRHADTVVGLAAEVHTARREADLMRGLATGAAISRASEHGVSIDEEMVDLVRYQRALEAASRVMTTVDEALDVLINRTGVVGR